MVGTVQRVLVEQVADRHPDELLGTADNMRSVLFKASNEQKVDLLGKFVEVKISEFVSPHMVRGELVGVLS